ncbi:hypothetical protein ACVIGB_001034 [Bradyrhizobium sp. USDA 4341]
MSILVNADGRTKIYVAIDAHAETVLEAYSTVQAADKGVRALLKGGAENVTFHNITHPKCPDWLKEFVRSDREYCSRVAADLDKRAAGFRNQAADLVAQAENYERRASEWRELSEAAPASSGPGV